MQLSKVLVPVAGIRADDEALRVAFGVTRRTRARIYVIYVIEVKRKLPLDAEIEPEVARGEQVLDHAETLARQNDAQIETELLQARDVGPAIVDEAVERGVDAIVMGIPYKRRLGEFSIGATATYVLKNAPCRVCVCREPINQPAGGR